MVFEYGIEKIHKEFFSYTIRAQTIEKKITIAIIIHLVEHIFGQKKWNIHRDNFLKFLRVETTLINL